MYNIHPDPFRGLSRHEQSEEDGQFIADYIHDGMIKFDKDILAGAYDDDIQNVLDFLGLDENKFNIEHLRKAYADERLSDSIPDELENELGICYDNKEYELEKEARLELAAAQFSY